MEYCCHVWGAAAKTTLDLLDRVQNRAIRLIKDSGITNKLDTLKHRRDVADLTTFYKYSNGHCSKEVSEIMPLREKRVRETRAGTIIHGRAVTLSTIRTYVVIPKHVNFIKIKKNKFPWFYFYS